MKKFFLSIIIAGASLALSSCGNYTPEADNNFLMMRQGDIQIKHEVDARQKYLDHPTRRLNIIKFFRELFSCKPSTPPATKVNMNSTK